MYLRPCTIYYVFPHAIIYRSVFINFCTRDDTPYSLCLSRSFHNSWPGRRIMDMFKFKNPFSGYHGNLCMYKKKRSKILLVMIAITVTGVVLNQHTYSCKHAS